jgi:hypothetical protein
LRPASPFQAQSEISPGKNIGLRCATAGSTSPRLGHESFAVIGPLALLGTASYPVSVRQPAASLPASFTPPSRVDALRLASLAVTSLREDFHLQVDAHAGRTKNLPRCARHQAGNRTSICANRAGLPLDDGRESERRPISLSRLCPVVPLIASRTARPTCHCHSHIKTTS